MIAVDLGQSGCRINIDGEIHSTTRGKRSGEAVLDALEANFVQVKAQSTLVSLSLTGLFGIVGDTKPYLEICSRHFDAKEVAVIDDGLASFAGALAGKSGVALTLGGGVVAVGGKNQKFSHSDGLGSFFGDEGGGFWIGSRGLTRALATRDGRDSQIDLLKLLTKEVELFDQLESKNGPDATVLGISCAQKVLESSSDAAEAIRQEGAALLAKTIISAWEKVAPLNEKFSLTISGGLSKNENYKELIFKEIQNLSAQVELIDAAGDNLDGAIWIAENLKSDISPLLGWAKA